MPNKNAVYTDYQIKEYLKPRKLDKIFTSGQRVPEFRVGSSLEREWYLEQLDRMTNGLLYRGRYINPLYYFFLNFMIFEVPVFDKNGFVIDTKISYPTYTRIDEYIFDIMWQAKQYGWYVSLMGGRGIGKSYIFESVINREYITKPGSISIISGTSESIVSEAWSKMTATIEEFEKMYPPLKQKRYRTGDKWYYAAEEIIDETGTSLNGQKSQIKKVVYGKNADKTRGGRPSVQLIEEFAAFPGKGNLGNLKDVFSQSKGSWTIGGSLYKCFVMLSGTGGSVHNDDAKELFTNPEQYNIYPIDEWEGLKSGIFIPVNYKLTGTWEKDGVPDFKAADEGVTERRRLVKGDSELYRNEIQEYPLNLREVFMKRGKNLFNQDKLSEAWLNIDQGYMPKPERGFLDWILHKETKQIQGVEFRKSDFGNVYIVEHPSKTKDGGFYTDLYINGIDSIDMGKNDSVSNDGSKLCSLIKKRIIDGEYHETTSNIYVAWYNERSDEVRDDYETALKLTLYYGAKINLEWTRVNIFEYFRNKGYEHLFMKRPSIAISNRNQNKKNSLRGTPGSHEMAVHMDEKVRQYINDHHMEIAIMPIIEQCRDYNQLDRTPYDMVVAMGLCELADSDYMGKGAKAVDVNLSDEFVPLGYYIDSDGYKQHGEIRKEQNDLKSRVMLTAYERASQVVRWYDETGAPQFNEDYYKETGGKDVELEEDSDPLGNINMYD